MNETMQFTIGDDAFCTDGACGEVRWVVIDPVARALTHLVVEPKHRRGLGRLVPLDLVDATVGSVKLRCTLAAFDKLDGAETTQFLPTSIGYLGYGAGEMLSWPYYGLGTANLPETVTYDKVPLGEVAVHRGQPVRATDGEIGRVQGLVIDIRDHHVTHVLLQEGHLWRSKEVAIPIGAVIDVADGINLNIAKQDVAGLPDVDLDLPVVS